MNKLRFIALALCAVTAFGLICGCNDTKPAGTVSDGASSEDSILSKTGKLSEDEMKLIASDRLTKCNDLMHFLTVDCYDKYTDRSQKLPLSSPEYCKVVPDGKYYIKKTGDIYYYVCSEIGWYFYNYKISDFFSDELCFPYVYRTDNGTVLYSSGNLSPAFVEFKDAFYTKEHTVDSYEKYDVDSIDVIDKADECFTVNVNILDSRTNAKIRTDTILFECHSRNKYIMRMAVENGAKLSWKVSEDDAKQIIPDLIDNYNRLYAFTNRADTACVDESDVLEYSNGTYKKVLNENQYSIGSYQSYVDLSSKVFDRFCAESFIDINVYTGELPISFTDENGKEVLTASRDVINKCFVESNGQLYAGINTSGRASELLNSGYKILFSGNCLFIAEIREWLYGPEYTENSNTMIFVLTEDGYRIAE